MSIIPSFFGRRSVDPFSLEAFTDLANTHIDWKETPHAHIVKADLPGVKKEEVKIELGEGQRVLQISGEHSKEEVHKNATWHCIQRLRGKFLARFPLPENVNVEAIKASMDNGVLTLTLPKKPEPRSLTIQISGASEDAKRELWELCL